MSDEDSPDDRPSEAPGATPRESVRSRLESVIPEILKRAIEVGVEKARESPENVRQFVQDLKLPKEVAHVVFQQIDDTKNGLFRVVAKEMRDFLEHTNFAGELQKVLTTVQFEVNTTIRFTPNDRKPRPDAKAANDAKKEMGGQDHESAEPTAEDGDGEESAPSSRLPRPEVKTSVHIRSDEREVRARARRPPQGGT